MPITRLTGGLTPPDGSDPRTFPSIWNTTADRIEGTEGDLTTLTGRVDNLDTDDVAEGTNLYYTDARAEAAAPVQSVNSQTGAVSLGAADVGAYPDTNPSGFVDASGAAAAAPVQSVNTKTGTVTLAAADVGALATTAGLGDLADVNVTGATSGQLIAYNATNDEWELASPAGITAADITALNLTWADF